MTSLESLLQDASSFVISEFGFDVEQSKLKPYSFDNWRDFCQINNFDINSSGIYIPTSYSAYVRVKRNFKNIEIIYQKNLPEK